MGIRHKACLLLLTLSFPALSLCQQASDPLAGVRSLIAAGQYEQATQSLSQYLHATPGSAEAHFLLGYVYFRQQKAKDSLAEFTAGAKFQRPSAADLKIVASDYVLLRDYADADKWFSAVVSATPGDADAWYLAGRARYNENDAAGAASMFEHALALRPNYVEAENNLGLCWEELNKPSDARTAFQNAIDWQGSAPADAQPFLNLGTLLTEQGALDEALRSVAKAAELAPENPKVHEQLGDIYASQQKLSEAQREYERALALAPDIAALHFKLGKILRREGRNELSQKQFDICARLNGTQSSKTTPNPFLKNQPDPR